MVTLCNDLSDLYTKLSGDGVWINRAFSDAGYYGSSIDMAMFNRWYGDISRKLLLLPTRYRLPKLTMFGCQMLILNPDQWVKSPNLYPSHISAYAEHVAGYERSFDSYIKYLEGKGKLDKSHRTVKKITAMMTPPGFANMEFLGYTEEEIYTVLSGGDVGIYDETAYGKFSVTAQSNAYGLLSFRNPDPRLKIRAVFSKAPLKASVKKTVSATMPGTSIRCIFDYVLVGNVLMINFPGLMNPIGGPLLGPIGNKIELK